MSTRRGYHSIDRHAKCKTGQTMVAGRRDRAFCHYSMVGHTSRVWPAAKMPLGSWHPPNRNPQSLTPQIMSVLWVAAGSKTRLQRPETDGFNCRSVLVCRTGAEQFAHGGHFALVERRRQAPPRFFQMMVLSQTLHQLAQAMCTEIRDF